MSSKRAAKTAAGVLALLAVAAPNASAITVGRANDTNLGGYRVNYEAGNDNTDVVNHVTVTIDLGGAGAADDTIDFNESVAKIDAIVPNSGCKKIDAHNASCALSGDKEVNITLGKGDDSVFATSVSLSTHVSGDEGSDTAFTGPGNDSFGDGNFPSSTFADAFYGGGGNDTFDVGGLGKDTYNGGSGTDTIGSSAWSAITINLDGVANDGFGGQANVVQIENINGTSGDDHFTGGSGKNRILGGGGNDTINGLGDADNLQGGEGNDTIDGGPGADTVFGQNGNDALKGGADDDAVDGGNDSDTLAGGGGADNMNGRAGVDTVDYSASTSSVIVTLDDNPGDGAVLEGDNAHADIENVIGTVFDDFVNGNNAANKLEGGSGKDSLSGGYGTDTLLGGPGNDNLFGGPGGASDKNDVLDGGADFDTADYSARNDPLFLSNDGGPNDGANGEADTIKTSVERLLGGGGKDLLTGDAGNDDLEGGGGDDHLAGGGGNDDLGGGAGTDMVDYSADYQPVVATLDGVANDGMDTDHDGIADEKDFIHADVEDLLGGDGNDALTGDGGLNRLLGGPGNDVLKGLDGDDAFDGGTGADDMQGGNGIDGVTYATRFNNVVVSVGGVALDGDDADHDGVAEEGDVVRADIENVAGGSGDDNLRGGSKDNLLLGGPGADTLNGLGGVDVLSGQAGNDTLVGKGDALGDTLTCGADNDTASVDLGLDTVAADCETVS